MKYFSNLPIRSYETTIGNFTIVDMCSYYVANDTNSVIADVRIDNTETLIEAAHKIYKDVDSFWLFLFANKKINPFELLEESNTVLSQTVSGLTGIGVWNLLGEDANFPAGSLIFPQTNNTGSGWDFGSTGNFSLTGGFALIDSYNPFSKRAVVKYVEGFTLATLYDGNGLDLRGAVKGKTQYTLYDQTAQIYGITKENFVTGKIDYLTSDLIPFVSVKSEFPLIKKGIESPYEPIGTGGIATSINETIDAKINSIKAYLPGTIAYTNFKKVTPNYQVN